jgi:hypothetical protein
MEALNTTLGALAAGAALGAWIGFLAHRTWLLGKRKNLMLALRGSAVDWLRQVEQEHERLISELAEAVSALASANGKVAAVQKALSNSNLLGIIDEIDKKSTTLAAAQRSVSLPDHPA